MNINQILKGTKIISNSVFNKQQEYKLRFVHEDDNCWYVDLPEWPFDHHNLMMVAGADKLCAFLSSDDKDVKVSVIPSDKPLTIDGYAELKQKDYGLTEGSTYDVLNLEGFQRDIWLCPVTLFVLGRYPKYIYVKAIA